MMLQGWVPVSVTGTPVVLPLQMNCDPLVVAPGSVMTPTVASPAANPRHSLASLMSSIEYLVVLYGVTCNIYIESVIPLMVYCV